MSLQLTPGKFVPVTVAVNRTDSPPFSDAALGAIVTV
jgi:hypothetical protein